MGRTIGLPKSRSIAVGCAMIALLSVCIMGATAVPARAVITSPTDWTTYVASNRSSLPLTKPAGTTAGNLLLAVIAWNGDGTMQGVPAGWTALANFTASGSSSYHQAVYYKLAAASEPSSFTFTLSKSQYGVASLSRFTGVDQATPILGVTQNSGGPLGRRSTATLTALGLSLAAGHRSMLVAAFGSGSCGGTRAWGTASNGMSAGAAVRFQTGGANNRPDIKNASQIWGGGQTGNRTITYGEPKLSGNYWLANFVALNEAVTPLTVVAKASSKTYDGSSTASVVLTASVMPGDQVTINYTSASFADKNVNNSKTVTVSGISLSGADASKYKLTSATATASASITPHALNIYATSVSRAYNGALSSTGTPSASGLQGSDSVTGLVQTFDSKNVGLRTLSVSAYSVNDGNAGRNYAIALHPASALVSAHALDISAAADSRSYDGTSMSAGLPTVTGLQGSDSVSNLSQAFDSKNAGARTLSVSGYTVNDGNAGLNYAAVTHTASGSISKRSLSVSGAFAHDKSYDGTRTATVDFASASLPGVLPGDSVVIDSSAYTAQFASKDVGTWAVSVSGVSLSGADKDNYSLVPPSGLFANITSASTLVVSGAVARDKTYDGTRTATVDFSQAVLVGVAPGDDVMLVTTGYSASFDTKDVAGTKDVVVQGLALAGANKGNYTLAEPNLSAGITPRSLIVSAVGAAKTYDGTTHATVTLSSDKLASDSITLRHISAEFDSKNVGATRTVTVAGISISGTDAYNYHLASTETATSADITAAGLDIYAVSDSKTYDATTDSLGAPEVVGLQGSDTVGGLAQAFDSGNAGARSLSVPAFTIHDGNGGHNYAVSEHTASGSISAAPLAIASKSDAKTYDSTTGSSATPTAAGLKGSDSVTGLAQSFDSQHTGARTLSIDPGYVVADGNDGRNYAVGEYAADGSISPAPLDVFAASDSKTYDQTTESSAIPTVAGLKGSDSVTGLTQSFDSQYAGVRTLSVDPGYTVSDGNGGQDYTLAEHVASGSILALHVTGVITAQSKIYDGTTSATVISRSLIGTLPDDVVELIGGDANFDTKNVGAGKTVSLTGAALAGADSGGYVLDAGGSTTADIMVHDLTVTATGQNRSYDATTDATAILSSDKYPADSLTLSYTSAFFADKNVGIGKTVGVTGISASGVDAANYNLTNTNALTTASISPAGLTITGISVSNKTYDAGVTATVNFSAASLVGLFTGDDVAIDSSGCVARFASAASGAAKPVTVIGVTLSGVDAGNYVLVQPSGLTASIIGVRTSISRPTVSPTTPRHGRTAYFKAYVRPHAAALKGISKIYLSRRESKTVRKFVSGRWQRVKVRYWHLRKTLSMKRYATGKVTASYKLPYAGSWKAIVKFGGSAKYQPSKSLARTFTVK